MYNYPDAGDAGDLVTVAEACEIIGGKNSPIDRSTYYRGVWAGRYPRPLKIGAQAVRVSLSQLRQFRAEVLAITSGT
jgi:predicted DNA-binding transcriptional regulator AlpA